MLENKTDMRKEFEKRGFGIKAYSKAYGASHTLLAQVLDGRVNGKKEPTSGMGKVRKLMMQLKKDGVIKGALEWEK